MFEDQGDKLSFQRILVRLGAGPFRALLAQSPEKAAGWVCAKAVAGLTEAQIGWGHMLLDGYGTARDPEAAIRWFRLAALKDNADGLNMLGRCYELGWGVAPDPIEAARCYEQAAAKGHDWAQFNLATLMLATEGDAADLARALSLLVASARAGNPKAMNIIGHFREKGWTGPPKPRAAALWFRWAAQGGCFRGQFHHARFLLREGKITEASRWLRSSLTQSPPDFAREAGALLLRHEAEPVRRVAQEALALHAGD